MDCAHALFVVGRRWKVKCVVVARCRGVGVYRLLSRHVFFASDSIPHSAIGVEKHFPNGAKLPSIAALNLWLRNTRIASALVRGTSVKVRTPTARRSARPQASSGNWRI